MVITDNNGEGITMPIRCRQTWNPAFVGMRSATLVGRWLCVTGSLENQDEVIGRNSVVGAWDKRPVVENKLNK